MRVAIQTSTGSTYTSDPLIPSEGVTDEEIIGNLDEMFKRVFPSSYMTLEVNGRTKYFNPAHVVWAQVVK